MIRKQKVLIALTVILLVGGGLTAVIVKDRANVAAAEDNMAQSRIVAFDVSEDMFKFVFDEDPVFEEDGYPAYGNPFITEGYIYPAGTLVDGNGVNADGSAQYPDKVIGRWICRGYFIGDGAHTTEGAWVVTTQIYDFGDELGQNMLVSEGFESAVVGEAIARALTGGTGRYKTARGTVEQTLLGFNATEGVNATFTIHLAK